MENINEMIKQMKPAELNELAKALRGEIIDTVKRNGGHLSSNLGTVELTVALHRVLNLPEDRLIFDVGHQAYAHKLLSGRHEGFAALRTRNGVSGFCDVTESEYDAYGSGHAGCSIAAAYGMCIARDRLGGKENVVCVIGDGALSSGEALEALNQLGCYKGRLLIILNDNEMAISKAKGGVYGKLSRLTVKKGYRKTKNNWKKALSKNGFGKGVIKCLSGVKHFVKRVTGGDNFFEQMGIKYIGPVDGHDIKALLKILPSILECDVPVLLHVKTQKGKGFEPAEKDPGFYHGVGADLSKSVNTFSDSVSDILGSFIEKDSSIVALTAAMEDGTGLSALKQKYPDNVFDLGICEQSVVSAACGMVMRGLRPVVCVYSTFLQRAFDQIQQEVCLDGMPVIFMIDRAGFVGKDGKTHQGLFDLAYMRMFPNMTVLAPATVNELASAVEYALTVDGPVAIRYPNGDMSKLYSQPILLKALPPHDITKWQCVQQGKDAALLAVGPRCLDMALSSVAGTRKNVAVYNCTSVRPLDTEVLDAVAGMPVIILEEGVIGGGFASAVTDYYAQSSPKGKMPVIKVFAVKEPSVGHMSVNQQFEETGMDVNSVAQAIIRMTR